MIETYINKLLSSPDAKFPSHNLILNKVGGKFIFDLCVYTLLKIMTHSDTENTRMFSVIGVTVNIGKEVMKKYLSLEKVNDKGNDKGNEKGNDKVTFRE